MPIFCRPRPAFYRWRSVDEFSDVHVNMVFTELSTGVERGQIAPNITAPRKAHDRLQQRVCDECRVGIVHYGNLRAPYGVALRSRARVENTRSVFALMPGKPWKRVAIPASRMFLQSARVTLRERDDKNLRSEV